MSDLTYHIADLTCQYRKSTHPVLRIDELHISSGKMSFFVGASGVGKSTILETLGLMSNTIVPNSETKFRFYTQDGEDIDLSTIWQKRMRDLPGFRKKHLSFIFQDMNLFFHLSMLQNVRLPGILRGMAPEAIAGMQKDLFDDVLPDIMEKGLQDRSVVQMSGGQRQRLAFIRALCTDYSVLFADEPTGNLDPINARNLMQILSENKRTRNSTRIVVSHDIDLAIKYGDEIILIRKVPLSGTHESIGLIDKTSKFINTKPDHWLHEEAELSSPQVKEVLLQELGKQAATK